MRLLGLLVVAALSAEGQPIRESPKYDVVSVKPNKDSDFRFAFRVQPGGTLVGTGVTLKRLVMDAYDVPGFRVVGGPDWVVSKRWDLQAKATGTATRVQQQAMLLALLQEYFKLKAHRSTRQMPVYELTIDKAGVKFQPASGESMPSTRVSTGSIHLTKATSSGLATWLSFALARPVVDKTGLTADFNFALTWTPQPGEDGGPSAAGFPPGTPEEPSPAVEGPTIC